MSSDLLAAPSTIDFATVGAVHLDVTDLERSLIWWRDLVGLRVIASGPGYAELGSGSEPLVVLHAGAAQPVARGFSGLYHLALHVPNEPELARALARLLNSRYPISATDHVIAKSIYLSDPDGIGLELALETPERVQTFRWPDGAATAEIIDSAGRRRNGVEPLDVEEVLGTLPDSDLSAPLPLETKVGHVHLSVPDLAAAYGFYRDTIGLLESHYVPAIGWGDLYAGGALTHVVAVNVWQGDGAPPRPSAMAGMSRFTLRFDSAERLAEALSNIDGHEEGDNVYLVRDSAENVIALTT